MLVYLGVEEACKTLPVTFYTTTIKLKSVKGKVVGITIEPVEAEKNQLLTGDLTIENLQLNSGESFTKDLTCKIASGFKLGDLIVLWIQQPLKTLNIN